MTDSRRPQAPQPPGHHGHTPVSAGPALARSPMSTIESTVTKLLVATKQLLECLTRWAKGEASEQDVSDIYVNLGNEFNLACRAFLSAGVEVADLGDVPQALRVILEKALSEDASQENLDRYLPSIREIIVNLLRQLKQKQALLRSNQPPHRGQPNLYKPQPGIPQPPASSSSAGSGPYPPGQPPSRQGSATRYQHQPPQQLQQHQQPQYGSRSDSKQHSHSHSGGSVSSNEDLSRANTNGSAGERSEPRRPPRGGAGNPLAALQRGEALERRASRRFSAYQFAKLANGGTGQSLSKSVPELPPLPAGERERLSRSSVLPTKSTHANLKPEFTATSTQGVDDVEENGHQSATSSSGPRFTSSFASRETKLPSSIGAENNANEDVNNQTQSDNPLSLYLQIGNRVKKVTIPRSELTFASLRLHFLDKFTYSPGGDVFPDIYIQDPRTGVRYELEESNFDDVREGTLLTLNIHETSSEDIKKHFDDSLSSLTRIISEANEKILERLSNQPSLGSHPIGHTSDLRLPEKDSKPSIAPQTDAATETKALDAMVSDKPAHSRPISEANLKQISDLRHDLSVVRQLSTSTFSDFRAQASSIMEKLQSLQSAAVLPVAGGSLRSYMESCHQKLSTDTDRLLTSVDDLQDIIEALRKDVAQRGVRHSLRQLDYVYKELTAAQKDLDAMERYISSERGGWKKIWEKELDAICEEQQFFKLQEELVADLQDDLKKAAETFSLVEQCSQEQLRSGKRPSQTVVVPVPVDGIVHAKDAVLSEVVALQPNHEQRVEAIERAEKLRKKELEMRGITDGFEEELGEFINENKLKKAGGIEETERRRKLREQQVLDEQLKNEAEAKVIREAERQRKRQEKESKKKKSKDGEKKKKKKSSAKEDKSSESKNNDIASDNEETLGKEQSEDSVPVEEKSHDPEANGAMDDRLDEENESPPTGESSEKEFADAREGLSADSEPTDGQGPPESNTTVDEPA
uniref:ARAD1D00858p n=1 Tax=Blastobotrys adeninivorans TaxID=409370 RepID=A0A060T849_BLAAD